MLSAVWTRSRGGSVLAFIVDHHLRPESRVEAEEAANRLARLGIPARILPLTDLAAGPGLPARARAARFAALAEACAAAGILDLVLGHHAGDQAETVIMRGLRGSGVAGLAGMAAVVETATLRLLRPLLAVPPGRLRATLRAQAMGWADDPTNADPRFTRARLRALRADAEGSGPATRALAESASHDGARRHAAETAAAAWLAAHVTLRPEGFALLPEGGWPTTALAVLLRTIAGAGHGSPPQTVAAIAAAPDAMIGGGICLGGARLVPAGRLGAGFLLCREAAAMAGPVPAQAAAVWDGRFRRPAHLPDLPSENRAFGWLGKRFQGPLGLAVAGAGNAAQLSQRDRGAALRSGAQLAERRDCRAAAAFFSPAATGHGRPISGACGRCYRYLERSCHAGSVIPA